MKIGILTWFFGNNYGAKAHSYALQEVIKSMGHTVQMIAYYPRKTFVTNIRMNLNTPHIGHHPIIGAQCLLRCKRFNDWTKNHYNITKRVCTAEEIDSLGFDLIIVGSDEVFNYMHPLFDTIYYGKGLKTRLVAYAPSSGQANYKKIFDNEIKNSLSYNFKLLSARDQYTKQLIQNNVDRAVQEVLDPTFLYQFKMEVDPFEKEKQYLLIYSFDTWDIYRDHLRKFASAHNLKIISVGRHCSWADVSFTAASVYDWLSSFRHAKFIFTDSFHGVVFAIKNQKQFMIVSRQDKINKINDVITTVGIKRDFYNGMITMEEYYSNKIDYRSINQKLEKLRKQSISYLEYALGGSE